MRIYTKTGDDGMTSLIGDRRAKDDARIEAYGTIDELNSFVHVAISRMSGEATVLKEEFEEISQLLFDCAADLANVKVVKPYKIDDKPAKWLEDRIDYYKEQVEPLKFFILPGGCDLSASIHVCRTVSRRAERRVVTVGSTENISKDVRIFINRLSDYFFITARIANKLNDVPDAVYKRSKVVFRGK